MSHSSETDAIKQDMDALRKDLRDLADSVRTSGEKRYQDGIDQARDKYNELRGEASRRSKEVGAEIEARPFTSVLAAFGVGLILGKLIGR
ncbi:MAG: hypothetical protein PF694_04550 [Bacteroidetes bacterium]|jgi:ElaB/YqjD/DUF883 family membrane-anchored ribosome-binding protein|nr:hypothetical protein [Bacteroidota bacterium]